MKLYLYFAKLLGLKYSDCILYKAAVITLVEINFGRRKNDNYFSNLFIFHRKFLFILIPQLYSISFHYNNKESFPTDVPIRMCYTDSNGECYLCQRETPRQHTLCPIVTFRHCMVHQICGQQIDMLEILEIYSLHSNRWEICCRWSVNCVRQRKFCFKLLK